MSLYSQSCLQPPGGPRMGQRVGVGTVCGVAGSDLDGGCLPTPWLSLPA